MKNKQKRRILNCLGIILYLLKHIPNTTHFVYYISLLQIHKITIFLFWGIPNRVPASRPQPCRPQHLGLAEVEWLRRSVYLASSGIDMGEVQAVALAYRKVRARVSKKYLSYRCMYLQSLAYILDQLTEIVSNQLI